MDRENKEISDEARVELSTLRKTPSRYFWYHLLKLHCILARHNLTYRDIDTSWLEIQRLKIRNRLALWRESMV